VPPPVGGFVGVRGHACPRVDLLSVPAVQRHRSPKPVCARRRHRSPLGATPS